ncbi:aminoglycoside phosphotransferase family protein [Legionella sp. W05-934-2]|jgi:streptomycin 6-kinase|uniref:aminoglycoside phosphotransferase family protein n=1 Tax=Legionella sp. W05-934-2 TaxID=1198649 RepID=UPI0034628759
MNDIKNNGMHTCHKSMFEAYINHWHLQQTGDIISTPSSCLMPVIYHNQKAMLKIALSPEEQQGISALLWWNGHGAVPVIEHFKHAILMKHASENSSLVDRVDKNQDDDATRIICQVVKKLHNYKKEPIPSQFTSLDNWFRSLYAASQRYGGIYAEAEMVSRELLSVSEKNIVLHGDIHHQNILDFGELGWLAIDPKGLIGDPCYDYANLFCNPDYQTAVKPGRLNKQADIVAKETGIDKNHLFKWIFVYAALSAAWSLEDGDSANLALEVAEISKAEMQK